MKHFLNSSPSLSRGGGPSGDSRMVEGQARKRYLDNAVSDSDMAFKDILRGNANRNESFRLQPRVAPHIALRPVTHIMRDTVNLDHQIGIRAIEINAKFTARMLAAELYALRLAAQQIPKKHFGQAHFLAQFACAKDRVPSRFW
jgi:hypothetical protein